MSVGGWMFWNGKRYNIKAKHIGVGVYEVCGVEHKY